MNAKKAKALRKVLRNLQKSNPEIMNADQYLENIKKRKTLEVQDLSETGEMVTKNITLAAGTITVNPKSSRGLYLHLKNELQ